MDVYKVFVVAAAVLLLATTIPLWAASDMAPKKHFKILKPTRLTGPEALSVYDNVRARMVRGYGQSGEKSASRYQQWDRLNTQPYPSATHGNRYVNNYANAMAKGYGKLKEGQKLAAGSILAKDSFTVTASRNVFPGALFIMEKLTSNASPTTGNWRYQMIMPDGSLFGDTQGAGADKVAFCAGCHATVSETDYVFQVPKKYQQIILK